MLKMYRGPRQRGGGEKTEWDAAEELAKDVETSPKFYVSCNLAKFLSIFWFFIMLILELCGIIYVY